MATSTIVSGYSTAANMPLKGYIPQIYSPKLRDKFWDNTILRKICNTDFTGQFKGRGDTIRIRCMPTFTTTKMTGTGTGVSGAAGAGRTSITYAEPQAEEKVYTINRGRYYAFHVDNVQQAFSDIPNWAEKWTDDGAKQLAVDEETEFFEWVASEAEIDPANKGTAAGKRGGRYNLGAVGEAVTLSKTEGSGVCTPTEFITRCAAVLNEQPGGFGLNPYVVIPVWMTQMLQNSELKAADLTGDPVSLLRRDAVASIGKIAGMDVYVSNLLPHVDSASADGNDGLATPILFGDKSAITFADELTVTEVIKDKDTTGDFHRSVHIYDFFARYPERFGVGYVTKAV